MTMVSNFFQLTEELHHFGESSSPIYCFGRSKFGTLKPFGKLFFKVKPILLNLELGKLSQTCPNFDSHHGN